MLRIAGFSRWWREEKGVSLIEYALLGALIAVICVLTITAVGTNTLKLFTAVCDSVADATGNPPC